jgi:hypothetical protein
LGKKGNSQGIVILREKLPLDFLSALNLKHKFPSTGAKKPLTALK